MWCAETVKVSKKSVMGGVQVVQSEVGMFSVPVQSVVFMLSVPVQCATCSE